MWVGFSTSNPNFKSRIRGLLQLWVMFSKSKYSEVFKKITSVFWFESLFNQWVKPINLLVIILAFIYFLSLNINYSPIFREEILISFNMLNPFIKTKLWIQKYIYSFSFSTEQDFAILSPLLSFIKIECPDTYWSKNVF